MALIQNHLGIRLETIRVNMGFMLDMKFIIILVIHFIRQVSRPEMAIKNNFDQNDPPT